MALELSVVHPDESIEPMLWEDAVLGRMLGQEDPADHLERLYGWVVERLADRDLVVRDDDVARLRDSLLDYLHRVGDGSPIRLRVGRTPPAARLANMTRRLDDRAIEEALQDRRAIWGVYDHPIAGVELVERVATRLGLRVHVWRMDGWFVPPLAGHPAPAPMPSPGGSIGPALEAALAFQPPDSTVLLFLDLPTLHQFLELQVAAAQLTRLAERVRYEPRLRLVVLRPEDEIPPRWQGLFRLVRLRTSHSGTPILDALAEDVTARARSGDLPPLVGREQELERLLDILNRATGIPNSPLLVGPAGTGKTAIVEGLAQAVAGGAVPARFQGRRVMSLNVTALGASAQQIGQLEGQLRGLTAELEEHGHELIVFVDELHTILRIGGPGAPAAQALKTSLGRGQIALVGATTDVEVAEVERDPAFSRRFSRIVVTEPDLGATTEIAARWRDRLEEFHGVSISDEIVRQAVEEADWHLVDQHRPYSAITLLGDAASRAQRRRGRTEVQADDLFQSLGLAIGMDVRWPAAEEAARLAMVERRLMETVIGQDDGIRGLMQQVRGRRFRRDRSRQPFSTLLVGPTGVGKTEVAMTLGALLFPGMTPVIYHMESFALEHQAIDLIGAPASYVGFDQGSRLVNDVRGRPRIALCFDEIEKAHTRVAQVLMGLLDRGEYIDPRGLRGDFRHAWFLFTSNVVSDPEAALLPQQEFEQVVRQAFAARGFAPEQVARFGRPIRFRPLDPAERALVTERALLSLAREYRAGYDVRLEWDANLPHELAELAGDPALGVRPILLRLQDVRAALVDAIFGGRRPPSGLRLALDPHDELVATEVGDGLVLSRL